MTKTICFFYVETNGLHNTNNMVTKKNLYLFARPVIISYIIGSVKDNLFTENKNIKLIIKPRCMYIEESTIQFHNITNEIAQNNGIDPEECINIFLNDLKKVDIIISHNINFHLKTIIAEAVKYNIFVNFNKFLIIDINDFYHNYGFIKLIELGNHLNIKKIDTLSKIELVKVTFFKLYSKFIKSIP